MRVGALTYPDTTPAPCESRILPSIRLASRERRHNIRVISAQIEFLGGTGGGERVTAGRVPCRSPRTEGGRRAGGRNRLNAAALVLGVVYDHDS